MTSLTTLRTPIEARAAIADWRAQGLRTALVPTMGALHEGHLSLVHIARENADKVVASLFVNPTQFAPGEDFDAYPRDEAADADKLKSAGCDLLYAPDAAAMYAPGFSTSVTVTGVGEGLESLTRPHFFTGVATVVAKLLNQTRPDAAVFGEKDYQQLLVIRRLNADLDFGVDILAGPTVREADGLAMSSRNAYLSAEERETATRLNAVLREAAAAIANGAPCADEETRATTAFLDAGFDSVDYVAVRDADTLAAFEGPATSPARVLAAVKLGRTRLIDNVAVEAG